MAISELQIALIGAGVAAVGIVWGYNVWQDRQHRKTAARIFKGGQDDALLGAEGAAPPPGKPAGGPESMDGERREPHLPRAASDDLPQLAGAAPAGSEAPPAEPVSEPVTEPQAEAPPEFPADRADRVADCVLHLVAAEPVPAPAVWAMQNAWSGDIAKPMHWLARSEAAGAWQAVDAEDTGRYREWAVALQLVDRRGPVSDAELARFFEGVQQVAGQAGAVL